MCSVSMVHDFTQQHHPATDPWWTPQKLSEYREIINRLAEIDRKLNLPECDPNKGAFVEELRKRLAAVEEKVGITNEENKDVG